MTLLIPVFTAAGLLASPPYIRGLQTPARPHSVLTGVDSRIEKTSFLRLDSPDALRRLWAAHLGKSEREFQESPSPALDVNFDRCTVIAIFSIEKRPSVGLRVVTLQEYDDHFTLRFENLSIAHRPTRGEDAAPPPITHAYAFIVLPMTPKPIVVEEDVRTAKNQPPEWKVRAQLPGAPD